MRIENVNPYGATSPEAIADFEARWSVVLPPEYKTFLLTSNGGSPTPGSFRVLGWYGHGTSVMFFYGIHEAEKVDRLDLACKVYKERVPADLIPIAYDASDNNICIGWTGERKGKVYFWDHEDELDEDGDLVTDYRNVYLVANSLQEFLDGLMTHEELDEMPLTPPR
jgi:hypothetical protein